jgi:hypothetical protein
MDPAIGSVVLTEQARQLDAAGWTHDGEGALRKLRAQRWTDRQAE